MQPNSDRKSGTVIFVFGSNQAGRHGKGDALIARQRHGAIYGQGEGLQGQSYGVPTKDFHIRSLPLTAIQPGVTRFVEFATANPELSFEVQALGCRLAGYEPWQIAPMFAGAPKNCYFHPLFSKVLLAAGQDVNTLPAPVPSAPLEQEQGAFAF